ncbi:MAG: DnaA/Hda family protein [bacterium]|nr:DnaA/Hda family protein [bacterium]
MNQNEIKEFQENFTCLNLKTVKENLPDDPFLKSEYSYALSTGYLTGKFIIIYSNDNTANDFVDKLFFDLSKRYKELYLFVIDIKQVFELKRIDTLLKFKNIFPYANILLIKNFDDIEKHPELEKFIGDLLFGLKSNSFLLITSSKKIDEIKNIDRIKNFLQQSKVYNLIKEKRNGNNFINFVDFISQVKKEAGVEEKLEEEENREEFIEKLYVWEMKGFNVETLKNIINSKDLGYVRREFEKFTDNVRKLIDLHKEYGLLNVKKFKEESKEIETMLFDPDKVEILREKINLLKEKLNYFSFFEKETSILMNMDNFIIDSSNRHVVNKINEIINGVNIDKIVLITGGSGTGKTHLLNALFNKLTEKRVIFINKNNIQQASDNFYVMKFLNESDMVLIDDLDGIYEKKEFLPVVKNILSANIVKVITLQRKFSIDDREILDLFNKYTSFNIQPTTFYIRKNYYKNILQKYGIKLNDLLFNFLLDYVSLPLSEIDRYFVELKKYQNNITEEIIKKVFPTGMVKKREVVKKGEFDSSKLIKEWINDTDRLYVEFEV